VPRWGPKSSGFGALHDAAIRQSRQFAGKAEATPVPNSLRIIILQSDWDDS
jgi:hypothetical protein